MWVYNVCSDLCLNIRVNMVNVITWWGSVKCSSKDKVCVCVFAVWIYRGYSNVWSEYDFYFIEWSEKMYISWVLNMTFISSSEVKKCIFHSCLRHEWNIHFFTSLDEIKVIFTTNIWIFFLLYTSLDRRDANLALAKGKSGTQFCPLAMTYKNRITLVRM